MFGNSNALFCPFCNLDDEKATHIFECIITQKLWKQLTSYLEEHLIPSQLSLQTAFFGFLNLNSNLGLIQNHILLIFKIYLNKSRKYERVTLNGLIKNIANVITIERKIANNDTKKIEIHSNKWEKVANKSKV